MSSPTPKDKLRLLNSIRNALAGAGELIPARDPYYVTILDATIRDLKWVYKNADKIKEVARGAK